METLKEFIHIKKGIYLIDYNKMLYVVKWLSCSDIGRCFLCVVIWSFNWNLMIPNVGPQRHEG